MDDTESFLNAYQALDPSDLTAIRGLIFQWIRFKPAALFAELRDQRPILHIPELLTLITRYRDVRDVISRDEDFSVQPNAPKMDEVVGPFMLARDASIENYRDKSLMRTLMPHSDFARLKAQSRQLCTELLPSGDGPVDLVATLTRKLPIAICAQYFGFPGPDVETMHRWSKDTQEHFFKNLFNNQEIQTRAEQTGQSMRAYLKQHLGERRAAIQSRCQDTVVDRLLKMERDGYLPQGFDSHAMIANVAGLLVGSVETTSQAVVQALQQILMRPEVAERATALAREDESDLKPLTDEALRFNPINPLLFRLTHGDVLVAAGTEHALTLPTGHIVLACTASAMHDERSIDQPQAFREGRPSSHYFHFGHGSHRCLGEYVGGIMITEMLRMLLRRGAKLIDGEEIDFQKGFFPERFVVHLNAEA